MTHSKIYNIPKRYREKLLSRFNYNNAADKYSSLYDSDLKSVRRRTIDISCILCDDYFNSEKSPSCIDCPLNRDRGSVSGCVKILLKNFDTDALHKAGLVIDSLTWKPADDDVVKDLLNNIHNALQTKVNWT